MLRLVPAGGNCVRVSAGCSAEADVNAGQHSFSSKRKRRRFVVATGSPAASDFRHCSWLLVIIAAVRVLRRPGRTTFWFSVKKLFHFEPVLEAVIGYLRNAKLLPFECCVDRVELRSGFRLLPESSGFLAVLIVAQYKHVAYTHGNPGSTAGHSFNPAGGAPGGG
ncbi:hypothetical protein F511_19773 [Dorcoceras hygrometricum]|uniref:Uncharacterized protein n=1 Tax=Dorcoceras hygrometricum TaxID=472368 RepID=A0A2Z7BL61_9LAMI|nr:hypothetical protein F511_19773 [Dorcoceras hygrometricum]